MPLAVRTFSAGIVGLLLLTAGAAFAAEADPQLPAGQGVETVKKVCSGCHAAEMVLDRHGDKAMWEKLVNTMMDRGATPTDDEIKVIVDYLSTNLPAEPAASPSPAAAPAAAPAPANP